tara:strand:- start:392 stop:646 length:255 start_codon:yes stop_codon:yes gene_type:complete
MPFKSGEQRRYMWAKEPEIAEKWEEYATGGMIEKSIKQKLKKLPDYSSMRAGGMIDNGSLMPKHKDGPVIEGFQDLVYKKSKGC